jgi:hypothetical protein
MRNLLTRDGVLVINAFGELKPGQDFLTASLHKTLKQVFRSVQIHAAATGNVFFLASGRPKLTRYHQGNMAEVHPLCRSQVAAAFASGQAPDPQAGIVLTDDFNPAEYYDAANREILRRKLAVWMRR